MAQAMEYESWDDPSDRVRRFFNEIGQTHPYAVRRVSEVMKWVQSGEYDRIVARRVPHPRPGDRNVREEAGDAVEFYAERFRAIFREMGDNITNARLPGRRRWPSRSPTGSRNRGGGAAARLGRLRGAGDGCRIAGHAASRGGHRRRPTPAWRERRPRPRPSRGALRQTWPIVHARPAVACAHRPLRCDPLARHRDSVRLLAPSPSPWRHGGGHPLHRCIAHS